MEEASNKRHPSLPANYVTLVDLKHLWLQKQKQKQRDDENWGNGLNNEGNELDQERNSNKSHPSLPANYVTLVDLRERWLQKQKEKQNECKIEGNEQDQEHKASVQSNPNPRTSIRRSIEPRSWIQRNQSKQAQVVQAKQLNPPPPAVVRIVERNEAPAIRFQSKKPMRNWKRNDEKDDNTGAEIERKTAGLSLSLEAGPKSVTVRNFPPFKKQNEGGYPRFNREFRLNKDRSRFENGLAWVKKGEAS